MEGIKDLEVTPPVYADTPFLEPSDENEVRPDDSSPVQNKSHWQTKD